LSGALDHIGVAGRDRCRVRSARSVGPRRLGGFPQRIGVGEQAGERSSPRRRVGLGVDDATRPMPESDGGALSIATVSWTATSFASTYVEVIGTEGVVRIGWSRARFRKASSPAWEDVRRVRRTGR
jgi:hypothetical protein